MRFAKLLARIVKFGRLTYIGPDGRSQALGGGPLDGVAPVAIRLSDRAADRQLAWRPELAVGEAYMDGTLTVEHGSLYDFLALATYNLRRAEAGFAARVDRLLRGFQQHNPMARARRNAAHHYDLKGDFYDLFLDRDRQYSCAYFSRPDLSLEEAQVAKKCHIAAKLLLRPGLRVLDIGCGWGGLALSLAESTGVEVVGITLSREQLAMARRRAEAMGLAGRVRFELLDYRAVEGRFDRIVSVGMFEHVGCRHYREFFTVLHDHLTEDGVALLHSIGRSDGPGVTNPWIRKYIFPGGYSPALSEAVAAAECSRLVVTDIEVLRGHYALTLREWRRRFEANRARAAALYDERFCRMWEFYLAGAEAQFTHAGQVVFQMQLAKSPAAAPTTRAYLGEAGGDGLSP